MAKHAVNLCATVEARVRYSIPKCTVRSEKKWLPSFVLDPDDDDYMKEEFLYHYDHQWSDKAGGMKGGICLKCKKTVKDIRVRINPKTGKPVKNSSLARDIALTHADVPPIVEINHKQRKRHE